MKRTPFKNSTNKVKKKGKGLFDHLVKEKKGLFKHLKKESKDVEWARHRKEITPFFISNGLYDICELQLKGCIGNALPLQFAHSKKRIDIAKEEPERTIDLQQCIRVCTACHNVIEHLPERNGVSGREQMYKVVTDTIGNRTRRLFKWTT